MNSPKLQKKSQPRDSASWPAALLIFAMTLAAYWPAVRGEFLWDDPTWTTEVGDILRDFSGLWRIWTDPSALQQYYPLTGTSFWLDHQLWGWWTPPYHLENILLHALSGVLLWKLLLRLEVPGAWLTGAIFAVHPVMAESVAWITERKNVLAQVFFFASLLAYGGFASFWKDEAPVSRRVGAYALALVLFVGALFSKITTFALPPVILLLCWWKRGRIRWKEDVLPTLPFFALAITLGAGAVWLEKYQVGAQGAEWELTWPERILVAGRVPWFYLGKLLWPFRLCVVYPKWQPDANSLWHWIFPLGSTAVLAAAWFWRHRLGRGPVVAVFLFAVTLFPVLGFMNVYGMLFSYVADRWVYLSSPAVLALAVALVVRVASRLHQPKLLQQMGLVLLPLLAALTWIQAGQYRDSATLWRSTIAKNSACWIAYTNLGSDQEKNGELDEAIRNYQKSLVIHPDSAETQLNLGAAFEKKGQREDALAHYWKALEIKPDFVHARDNLGASLYQLNRLDEAVTQFEEALKLKPNFANANNNLGITLSKMGRLEEAVFHFERALTSRPNDAGSHNNLGNALFQLGRYEEAMSHLSEALKLKPDYAEAHNNLGNALLRKGRIDEAVAAFRKATELQPENPLIQNSLGQVLFQIGRFEEGIEHCQKALVLRPDYADVYNTLGNAYFNRGQVDSALVHYEKAVKVQPGHSEAQNNLGFALSSQGRLDEAIEHYQAALTTSPNYGLAHLNLGNVLCDKGREQEAVPHFESAIKVNPLDLGALNNLAFLLATSPDASLRDGSRAVELALRANLLTNGNNAIVLHTLAAAQAETGRYSEAAETAGKALSLASAQGNSSLAETVRNEQGQYLEGRPVRRVRPDTDGEDKTPR